MNRINGSCPVTTEVRHPGLDILCSRLERIWWGRAATQCIVESHLVVTCLPMFTWHSAGGAMGRKERGVNGSLSMPFRLEWDVPAVALSQDADTSVLDWSTTGPGFAGTGASRGMDYAFGSQHRAARFIEDLVDDGELAFWEICEWIEPRVKRAVFEAHLRVGTEIADSTQTEPRSWLDEVSLEAIASEMLLGRAATEQDNELHGSVARLIDLCLVPEKFHRVDPMRYMTTHLRRDAEQSVRRRIGDPRAGSKIRRFTSSLKPKTLDELVRAYRKTWPRDEVGPLTFANALMPVPDATVDWMPLRSDSV